ncbi:MAG: glycosyltransferase family 4 protein [Nitrospinota bacterium]
MNELYSRSLKKELQVREIKINYSSTLEELGKLNFKKFFGIFVVGLKVLFALIFFRPDVVCFEIAPMGTAFLRDSLYVWLCKIFRSKITFIFQAKGIKESTKNSVKQWYYVQVFRGTKSVILSQSLYEDIEGVVSIKDVFVVPNAVEDELTENEFGGLLEKRKRNDKPVLLFLSNMIESKGPLDTLEICNMLQKDKKDFKCFFVGNWKEEVTKKSFYEFIEKNNLSGQCQYLGPKYDEEKKEVLATSNFLIFPTKYEHERFPLVILEALMFGIPVVSYDNGAVKEVIDQEYLGYVSKTRTPAECFQWLREKIFEEQDHKKIREEFKKKYLLSHSADKLKSIVEKLSTDRVN